MLHIVECEWYDVAEEIRTVRFLCTRYPAMALQRSNDGLAPLNGYMTRGCISVKALQALCEVGGLEQVSMPVIHPTDDNYYANGNLPLHGLLQFEDEEWQEDSFLSNRADVFRLLVRLYPAAAGVENKLNRTPYSLTVERGMHDYYLRLLLRAAPTLNPAELHRLNYAERRMALFLAFKAITQNVQPSILVQLRAENKDLVRRIVSFL
jgi:hypothetical protein